MTSVGRDLDREPVTSTVPVDPIQFVTLERSRHSRAETMEWTSN